MDRTMVCLRHSWHRRSRESGRVAPELHSLAHWNGSRRNPRHLCGNRSANVAFVCDHIPLAEAPRHELIDYWTASRFQISKTDLDVIRERPRGLRRVSKFQSFKVSRFQNQNLCAVANRLGSHRLCLLKL
jgi:hypothetical protein